MVADPVVMPLARQLQACFLQEISKVEDPPGLGVQLRPGTTVDHLLSTAQDECCAGLAWVRPAGFFPSSATFPVQDPEPVRQGVKAWAVQLEMGAIRCAPVGDENVLPTAEQWETTTQAVMDDAAAMRRAACCLIDQVGALRVMVGLWQPLAVEGGCVGGILTITVRGPACDCADAGPAS